MAPYLSNTGAEKQDQKNSKRYKKHIKTSLQRSLWSLHFLQLSLHTIPVRSLSQGPHLDKGASAAGVKQIPAFPWLRGSPKFAPCPEMRQAGGTANLTLDCPSLASREQLGVCCLTLCVSLRRFVGNGCLLFFSALIWCRQKTNRKKTTHLATKTNKKQMDSRRHTLSCFREVRLGLSSVRAAGPQPPRFISRHAQMRGIQMTVGTRASASRRLLSSTAKICFTPAAEAALARFGSCDRDPAGTVYRDGCKNCRDHKGLATVPVVPTVFTAVPVHGPCTVPVTGAKPRQRCFSSWRETDPGVPIVIWISHVCAITNKMKHVAGGPANLTREQLGLCLLEFICLFCDIFWRRLSSFSGPAFWHGYQKTTPKKIK